MSNRMERANAQIQKALSEIISYELNNPKLSSMLTISSVDTSIDFAVCKVKVSVLSKEKQDMQAQLKVLKQAEGFIKKLLLERVKMPKAPKLVFLLDEGYLHSERINEILDKLEIPKLDEEK